MANPKVGDAAWWRGMRCEIVALSPGGAEGKGIWTYETVNARVEDPDWRSREVRCLSCETEYDTEPDACEEEDCASVEFESVTEGRTVRAFRLSSNIADAVYDPDLDLWYCPGIEGKLPAIHVGAEGQAVIEDPEIPTCSCEEGSHEHEGICGAITWHVLPVKPPAPGEPRAPGIPRCASCSPGVGTPLPGGS